jgi:UPF0755 protein
MKLKNTLYIFVIFATLFLTAAPIWTEMKIFDKKVYTGIDSVMFEIPKGYSLSGIADILKKSGFNISEFELKLTAKLLSKDGLIGHGRFIYDPKLDLKLKDFVGFLAKGGHLTINLTVPEGSRIREIAGILQKELKVDSALFVERTQNKEILTKYGISAGSLEGYLYPETYNFNESDSIDDIIDRMVNTYKTKIIPYKEQIENSGYTEHEVLTLASIIQGEVMVFDEIYKISAVYNNRLKKGMLMQSDPTIQYLFDKPKRLLNKDIAIDSPYNTYLYKGLPPGPVNNPSVKAVKAALEPEDVPYIYMVAKGDGSHNFNTDLQGHLRDKAEFDKIRKKFN